MAKSFWPGFRWRILVHESEGRGKGSYHTGKSLDLRTNGEPKGYPGIRFGLDGEWEFDELVIDDWFHIEQMSERHWWIGVGNGDDYWHVNVSINGKGQAQVSVQKQ